MIISHKYRFIFIKTQKTAGTSLEIALSKICSRDDIITPISQGDEIIRKDLGYIGPQNYNISPKKNILKKIFSLFSKNKKNVFYNHMSANEIKELVGDQIYNSYYKFCFERNPYDKVISLFYHEGGYNKWDSIESFILEGGLKIIKGYDQYSIDKVLAVDDIFKYEEMKTALKKISSKLLLDEELDMSSIKAKSNFRKDKRHYSEVLTESEIKLIDVIWAREKELMNYIF